MTFGSLGSLQASCQIISSCMQCGYCINTASLKSPDDGLARTELG